MSGFTHTARAFSTGFLIALVLHLSQTPVQAHSSPATKAYGKAKSCQTQLYRSSRSMRYRDRWENCIRLYEKYLEGSRRGKLKEKAHFNIADLAIGLSRYSGRASDRRAAENRTAEFKRSYPKSALVKTLEKRLVGAGGAAPKTQTSPPRARLRNVRHGSYDDHTRVVFDLSKDTSYRDQRDDARRRLLIDLDRTAIARGFSRDPVAVNDKFVKEVRVVQITPDRVRAILALRQSGDYSILRLNNPDRVVVDVYAGNRRASAASAVPRPRMGPIRRIMIDPGHGGKDPGAVGRRGLAEKEVVLDVSKRLRDLITQRMGKEVLMTRDRDVFIPLEERTQQANAKQADLFISVHANAAPDRRARGVEIYTLGKASDPSALATAARENSIHADALKNLDGAIKIMLADLSVTKRLDQSLEFAHATREGFTKHLVRPYKVPDLGVKQAPFYVLMNAAMPSILAEISFISNPTEEKRLRTRSYRRKIAESLYEGVRQYILKYDRQAKAQPRPAGR